MSTATLILVPVLTALVAVGFGPTLLARLEAMRAQLREARRREAARPRHYDPGRERRAERKARELMRSVVSSDDYEMYERLGFLRFSGRGGYGYLIYPHRPIVSYDARTYRPLSEYCVEFPDRAEEAYGHRLPDADDALAKWMSLHGDERGLIAGANMHAPGRQLDPACLRRDLRRLRAWEQRERVKLAPVRPVAAGNEVPA